MTGKSLNTLPGGEEGSGIEYGFELWTRPGSVHAQRILKVVPVFSYLD